MHAGMSCAPAALKGALMKKDFDRRKFLQLSGMSIGVGALFQFAPPLFGESAEMMRQMGKKNGEGIAPFSFVQLSDAHVGFNGPPDPLGTKAFERAVEMVNALPQSPDLVLFTGDLTHDTADKDTHANRMRRFLEISKRMNVPLVKYVPGEHDAGLDAGQMYREF